MAYTVILKRQAEKELDRLPTQIHSRIVHHLLALETDPRPPGNQKLQGHDGYRLRVGDYRILYTVEDANRRVEVHAIGHRREVYR